MNTTKLKEALIELKQQKAIIDNAISDLEQIIKSVDGSPAETIIVAKPNGAGAKSYIDLTIAILQRQGQPIHIKEICKQIAELKGKDIPRASVEAALIREIAAKGEKARIAKVSPGMFALPHDSNTALPLPPLSR